MFLGTDRRQLHHAERQRKSGQTACNGTFNLAGGQIVVQGVVDTAAVFVRDDAVPLSIIGGNGIYQNASGDGTVQLPPEVAEQDRRQLRPQPDRG